MQSLLQQICEEVGLSFHRAAQVLGGDINQSFCLHTNEGKIFVKLNDALGYPAMFAKEAAGLRLLQNKSTLIVPGVRGYGQTGDKQWLMLEWMERGVPASQFWKEFGKGLAGLHRNSQTWFGLATDNYIGSISQSNQQHQTWANFYVQERILPLSILLFSKSYFSKRELRIAENAEAKLETMFPEEPPALLHGDLWSGNFMVTAGGTAAIFDPAVSYGHREMDIGMTLLFGGFDRAMYEAYNNTWPLEKNWKSRVPITQLYPLLVHAVLFGGHYINAASDILMDLD